jgi:hypothetical protein
MQLGWRVSSDSASGMNIRFHLLQRWVSESDFSDPGHCEAGSAMRPQAGGAKVWDAVLGAEEGEARGEAQLPRRHQCGRGLSERRITSWPWPWPAHGSQVQVLQLQ